MVTGTDMVTAMATARKKRRKQGTGGKRQWVIEYARY